MAFCCSTSTITKTRLTPRSHSFTRLQDGGVEMADARWVRTWSGSFSWEVRLNIQVQLVSDERGGSVFVENAVERSENLLKLKNVSGWRRDRTFTRSTDSFKRHVNQGRRPVRSKRTDFRQTLEQVNSQGNQRRFQDFDKWLFHNLKLLLNNYVTGMMLNFFFFFIGNLNKSRPLRLPSLE